MIKEILINGLKGIPVGISLVLIVAIHQSFAIDDGQFHFVSFQLINHYGSELHAAIVKVLFASLMGFSYYTMGAYFDLKIIESSIRTAITMANFTYLFLIYNLISGSHLLDRSFDHYIIVLILFMESTFYIKHWYQKKQVDKINDELKKLNG